jgi:hypothetical protein
LAYQRKVVVDGRNFLSCLLSQEWPCFLVSSIMRTFIKLRSFLAMETSLESKVNKLEQGTNKLLRVVFERFDLLEEIVETKLPARRKRIGLK